MKTAPIPANETHRLQELYQYDILHTQYEEDFDAIVNLASEICGVPISLISLIDTDKQFFKAAVGIDSKETGRDISFCAHALESPEPFIVEDALNDERFYDNPLVLGDPNIRFYAGMPLVSNNGFSLGTLCVIDRKPRSLNQSQLKAMKVLSKQVIKLFELRLNNKTIEQQTLQLQQYNDVQNKMISIIAHDVRSPLASLQQLIELNDMNVLDKEQTQLFVSDINQQVSSTINMLSNLIDWSTLLIETQQQEATTLLVKQILEEEKDSFTVAASIKQNTIEVKVDEALEITTDKNILKFILRNLLSNANKYTTAGTITIAATQEKDVIIFTITDTGIGMTDSTKNKLLQGGKQSSQFGTLNEKGSGVGFALVKDFIEKLGQRLTISSVLGKGTTVLFTLPVRI